MIMKSIKTPRTVQFWVILRIYAIYVYLLIFDIKKCSTIKTVSDRLSWICLTSLISQSFKGYSCESYIPLYKWSHFKCEKIC